MVEAVTQKVEAPAAEESATMSQYIEYLFEEEDDNDWEDQVHQFAPFNLTIRSRYTSVGVSRVSLLPY